MIHHLRTVDAHTAGEPLRLIVEGFPEPPGATMLEKRAWAKRHGDRLRRSLMLEPRGHADMYGAVLTRPERADSDAGVLFMHNEGFSTMSGHGVIAVATIVLERGLLVTRQPDELVLDTPAGQVVALALVARRSERRRVKAVMFRNVPSFVLHAGLPVRVGNREVRVDVAFGGVFYAIADAESVGLSLTVGRLPELRRAGMEIKEAVDAARPVIHPDNPALKGIYGTIFTGPAHSDDADLRNVTVFADGQVDRSPCGTGTSAVMAVLDGMSLLPQDRPFVHESIVNTTFLGRVSARTLVGEWPAIVPELEGTAWVTGDHQFVVDDEDPLREGFRA